MKFAIKFIVKCVFMARLHNVFEKILLPMLTAGMEEEAVKCCISWDNFLVLYTEQLCSLTRRLSPKTCLSMLRVAWTSCCFLCFLSLNLGCFASLLCKLHFGTLKHGGFSWNAAYLSNCMLIKKRDTVKWGYSELQPLKTGVTVHSEFSPVLTDVKVSLWSPVPH